MEEPARLLPACKWDLYQRKLLDSFERVKEQVDKGDPQMPKCAFHESLHQKL